MRPFLDVPVVRIDEAAARTAVEAGGAIAVFATAPMALEQSAALVERAAAERGRGIAVGRVLLPGTDEETVRSCMAEAARECDTILLAQPSMAKLAAYGEDVDARVLTVTESGFELLRGVVEGRQQPMTQCFRPLRAREARTGHALIHDSRTGYAASGFLCN